MGFFRKKRKDTINVHLNVADVYVVTSMIISSHNDGIGHVHRSVTMYFLAKCEDDEYYELFSGKKLEKEKQPKDGFLSKTFDIPYIKKIDPLNKYLRKKATIDMQSLFDFIVQMNVLGELRFFPYEEDAETLQEC